MESIKKISYFWTEKKTKNYKDFESFEMTLSQGNEIVNFIISYFSILKIFSCFDMKTGQFDDHSKDL